MGTCWGPCKAAVDFEIVARARQEVTALEEKMRQARHFPRGRKDPTGDPVTSAALASARAGVEAADAHYIAVHGHEQLVYRLSYLAVGQTPGCRLRATYSRAPT